MTNSTDAIERLFLSSGNAANRNPANTPTGPCVGCKRSVKILPLRYGVIASTDVSALKILAPDRPPTLGKALVPKLSTPRYAIRWLREGYVYVLTKRIGGHFTCEAAYQVHASGLLHPVWPDNPGVPRTGIAALGSWTITLPDPEDVEESRFLFSRDPLSPVILARYRDISAFRNRLQKFDVRGLVQGCSVYHDVLAPDEIPARVAEYLASSNPATQNALEDQAFPPFRSGLNPGAAPADMGSILTSVHRELCVDQGFAFVLEDAIGIAQELNTWRNDAVEKMRPWLETKDHEGISNERRYAVAQALDNVKSAMQKGHLARATRRGERLLEQVTKINAGYPPGLQFGGQYQHLYTPERVREIAAKESATAFDRYQKLLDWDTAKAGVQREFHQRDKAVQQEMDARSADHLAWIASPAMHAALDLYDRDEPVWGMAFAEQIGLSVIGLNGCPDGNSHLESWWTDTEIGPGNLGLRAMTRNQIAIEVETRMALAKAKADDVLTVDNAALLLGTAGERFKNVADLIAKSDAAVDAARKAGTHAWFTGRPLGHVFTLFAQLNQFVLKQVPGNAVDRRLLVPFMGLMHAQLGRAATNIRLQDLAHAGQAASASRVSGQLNAHIGRAREALAREFQTGGNSEFYKIRGGAIIALIEAVLLLAKGSASDKDTRQWAELTAAGLTTAAAGFELAAMSVGSVAARYGPATVVGRGSSIMLGGLKLAGGGLATLGGAIMAVLDAVDFQRAFSRDRYALASAYLAHAIVCFGIAGLSAAISLSASAPFLRWLLESTQKQLLRALLPAVVRQAEALATTQIAAMLGLALGWSAALGIAITVVVWTLEPDAMETWCRHSCFGLRDPGSFEKPHKDEATEIQRLYEALEAVN